MSLKPTTNSETSANDPGQDPYHSFLCSLQATERRANDGLKKRRDDTAALKEQIRQLQGEIRDLELSQEFVKGVQSALEQDHAGEALMLLDRSQKVLKFLGQKDNETIQFFDNFRAWLLPKVDETIRDLPNALPETLQGRGIKLDRDSRHPRYTVEKSFIILIIDSQKRLATIETRGTKKVRVAIDTAAIADTITTAHQRCFGRETDIGAFNARLHDAWKAARKSSSTQVTMPDLLDELSKNSKEFAVDEFCVDLSRLISSGNEVLAGQPRPLLDHTKNDADGVLLPGFEQRGYFGYIRFTTEGE